MPETTQKTTHDAIAEAIDHLHSAEVAFRNCEMELTGNAEEDLDSWDGVYSSASEVEYAAERLMSAVRRHHSLAVAEEEKESS